MNPLVSSLALALLFVPLTAADAKQVKGISERSGVFSPQEQQAKFSVPEGFVVELVASEENGLINPIDLAFDDAGRLWTQTAEMYPMDAIDNVPWFELIELIKQRPEEVEKRFPEYSRLKRLYSLETPGTDRILVIDDLTKQVEGQIPAFADGLAIPQSILPYKNGVYVAHGSEMLFFEDTNGDGKADTHKTVLTGFGINDSHTMAHTLVRGPGGWVHFSHGALNAGEVTAVASGESANIIWSKIARFSLDGTKLEVQNCGINNIWGFHLKENGQWWASEANDMGCSVFPFDPMSAYQGLGNEKIRDYQTFAPRLHELRVGGTGLSGLAYDENGSKGFPAKWKNLAFLANPITNSINCVIADRNPDGSVISEHREDFLTCEDEWFRPVNIEFGPDGCLYILDWYNKIISHNEVRRDHPERDKSHGRLWRVRHESQVGRAIPNVQKAATSQLLAHLKSEILWEKRAAWHQIADRQAKELVPELEKLVLDKALATSSRVHALWSLESLGAYNATVMQALLGDEQVNVVREALRSLASFKPEIGEVVALVSPLADHPHYLIREQVLRTLDEVGQANQDSIRLLVAACKPAMPNKFGGGYEQNFQRFLARKALERYPDELEEFVFSARADEMPTANVEWATQALGNEAKSRAFARNWDAKTGKLTAETLIGVQEFISTPDMMKLLASEIQTKQFIELALQVQPRVISKNLHAAMVPALKMLLSSGDESDRQLAFKAVDAFKAPGINDEILAYALSLPVAQVDKPLMALLSLNRQGAQSLLERIGSDTSLDRDVRLAACMGLTDVEGRDPVKMVLGILEGKEEAEVAAIIGTLAQSADGGEILLALLEQEKISYEAFEIRDGERVASLYPERTSAAKLRGVSHGKRRQRMKAGNGKIEAFFKAYQTLEGDPVVGQGVFASCMACHQVNGQGQNLGPALDGSANRDIKHLLTAIVKPDEAVEGGYMIYRITTRSGEIIEGLRRQSNEFGVSVYLMGGVVEFIPRENIATEVLLHGRSFMPAHYGELPEQMMVDLLTYIQTLK